MKKGGEKNFFFGVLGRDLCIDHRTISFFFLFALKQFLKRGWKRNSSSREDLLKLGKKGSIASQSEIESVGQSGIGNEIDLFGRIAIGIVGLDLGRRIAIGCGYPFG